MNKTQKTVFISLLVAQALILGLIEKMIPVPFISPGAKLGLSNIIIVAALYSFSFTEVLTIVVLKSVLLAIFGGTLPSFFYSLSGGILSFVAMFILLSLFKDKVGTIGISVTGAVFHNMGQIIVASLFVQNIRMVAYLPVLLIAGIGTGVFVGLTAQLLLTHMKKLSIKQGVIKNKRHVRGDKNV